MYLYWGYPQIRHCAFVDNILKVMNFLKLYIFSLLAHIHIKDTNFIFGTTHTHTHTHTTDTHRQMDTHFHILHFLCQPCQKYKF